MALSSTCSDQCFEFLHKTIESSVLIRLESLNSGTWWCTWGNTGAENCPNFNVNQIYLDLHNKHDIGNDMHYKITTLTQKTGNKKVAK